MSFDNWLSNLTGVIEMNTYKVTFGTGRKHIVTIQCANDTDACWQAYEIARRFGKPLVNVELA